MANMFNNIHLLNTKVDTNRSFITSVEGIFYFDAIRNEISEVVVSIDVFFKVDLEFFFDLYKYDNFYEIHVMIVLRDIKPLTDLTLQSYQKKLKEYSNSGLHFPDELEDERVEKILDYQNKIVESYKSYDYGSYWFRNFNIYPKKNSKFDFNSYVPQIITPIIRLINLDSKNTRKSVINYMSPNHFNQYKTKFLNYVKHI